MKPEFDGKRFSFPGNSTLAKPADVLRWAITRKPAKWPRDLTNPAPSKIEKRVHGDQLRLTFINHATVLVQGGGMNLITDPVFSKRVSPVAFAGPRRHRAPGIALHDLPPIDVVLLSHTHYDHLDIRSLSKLQIRDAPEIITPLNCAGIVEKGCGNSPVELSWWDEHALGEGISATLVPAQHWTSRKLGDENKSLWGGYAIKLPGGTVYFAGDTGYGTGEHFRLAQQRLGPFRCALLPIGAYEPRWFMKPQHMNPSEAVKAYEDLQVRYALGIHFGTFQLTDEAHDAPVNDLHTALAEHGTSLDDFRALDNGIAWDVPPLSSENIG